MSFKGTKQEVIKYLQFIREHVLCSYRGPVCACKYGIEDSKDNHWQFLEETGCPEMRDVIALLQTMPPEVFVQARHDMMNQAIEVFKKFSKQLKKESLAKRNKMNNKVVAVLSGGMDSTTLLYKLLAEEYKIPAVISFSYGQRHIKELECAKKTIAFLNNKGYNIKHVVLDVPFGQLATKSSLTGNIDVPEGHYASENMRLTVVRSRNLIFSAIASSLALTEEADLALGVHAGDHCIPDGEVVFTKQGKKTIFELEIDDEILSFSTDSKQISFQKVINKINEGYRKDIVRINTKGGRSLASTGNHKFYKVNRHSFHQHTGWQKEIVEEKAENLLPGDWIVVPCSDRSLIEDQIGLNTMDLLPYCDLTHSQLRYDDDSIWFKENNKVKRHVPMESFIKLLAWFITEGNRGSSKQAKNTNTYRVGIPQSILENPENCCEIQKVIEDWGFTICECNSRSNDESCKTYYFSGPTTRVFELCGNISFEKKIPEQFMFINPKLLLKTLIKGDGYTREEEYLYQYITSSSVLKEQVCFLGVALGYSVGNVVNEKGTFFINLGKNLRKNMNRIGEVKIVEIKAVEKEQPQNVWDITVENNHNFFAGLGSGILVSNSIYPDCREEFIQAAETAIKVGNWDAENFKILVPFLHISKGDIVVEGKKAATALGIPAEEIYKRTWTCYKGLEKACGKCGSCVERIEAFHNVGLIDPVKYEDDWDVILNQVLQLTK